MLSRLDLTSLGSPANTSVKVFVSNPAANNQVAAGPVTNGTAPVVLNSGANAGSLVAVAYPSETLVGQLQSKWVTTVTGKIPTMTYGTPATLQVTTSAPTTATGKVTVKAANGNTLVQPSSSRARPVSPSGARSCARASAS